MHVLQVIYSLPTIYYDMQFLIEMDLKLFLDNDLPSNYVSIYLI